MTRSDERHGDELALDLMAIYNEKLQRDALEAITEDLLADYIRDHLQSRGARVGQA